MASISVKEARRRFAQLVETARCGNSTTITRRGRKVAKLTGADEKSHGGLPDMTAFRAALKTGRNSKSATIEKLRQAERY